MKKINYRSVSLFISAGLGLFMLSSCFYTHPARVGGVHTSIGYSIPSGYIRTANSRWFYNPYYRSYYNLDRGQYYNYRTKAYSRTAPKRYNNAVYPYNWNRQGVVPAPRISSINNRAINSTYRTQSLINRNVVRSKQQAVLSTNKSRIQAQKIQAQRVQAQRQRVQAQRVQAKRDQFQRGRNTNATSTNNVQTQSARRNTPSVRGERRDRDSRTRGLL